MLWFQILTRHGELECKKLMIEQRDRQLQFWQQYPEEKFMFVQRLALIASESGTLASTNAKLVMVTLLQAGYDVDLVSFGKAVGFMQLQHEDIAVNVDDLRDCIWQSIGGKLEVE